METSLYRSNRLSFRLKLDRLPFVQDMYSASSLHHGSAKRRSVHTKRPPRTVTAKTMSDPDPISGGSATGRSAAHGLQNVKPIVWSQLEFERIKQAARVPTHADKVRHLQTCEDNRQQLAEECEKRKQQLLSIDERNAQRRPPQKNHLLEWQTADHKQVLDRATVAKQEGEEELKRANRIILAAKCQIIREAQIMERRELERAMQAESLRLERLMDEDRQKAIDDADRQLDQEKAVNKRHAAELQRQLEARHQERELAAKRVENEAKYLQRAQRALEVDLVAKRSRKDAQRARLRSDLHSEVRRSEWLKRVAFEEERIAELRIQEYMRTTKARADQLALQRKLADESRVREQERLVQQRQKAMDSQHEQFEVMVRREQERKEREYRQREKEAAVKRIELQQSILEARRVQQEELKRIKEAQVAKETAEYHKNLEKWREEMDRDRKEEVKRNRNRETYCEAILAQIKEREKLRAQQKLKAQQEFEEMKRTEKCREECVQQALQRKIQDLKDSNIPDRLIKDVKRQLNLNDLNG